LLCAQPYSTKKLKEFIAYARAKVFPKFSDEAAQAVVDCYKTLRQQGRTNEVRGGLRGRKRWELRLGEMGRSMKALLGELLDTCGVG
jgi:hypothetical protein